MRKNWLSGLILMVLLAVGNTLNGQSCSCVDCPVSIFNLQTHTSSIDVQVAGPNDLGSCGLNEVCFTIFHTWVGDLSVSLISPAGKKYLVMADVENMPPNGCGNSANNIDICVTVGTGNPITNNSEYVCNGTGLYCLEGGGFTVPCGGVTDPFDGALEAPNCDLADFNVPGDPANGLWTLVVNDICDLNIGQLVDWSLSFDCGTSSCLGCDADAGELVVSDITACIGDPLLDLSLSPTYTGSAPDPMLFDYRYLIVEGGVIVDVVEDPDLQSSPAGIYSICGISFESGQIAAVEALIGSFYDDIGANLGICFDLTDACLGVEIGEPIPSYTETIYLCYGNCYTALDGIDYCSTGTYSITYTSPGGCISSMTLDLTIEDELEQDIVMEVCLGGNIDYGGQMYSAGSYDVVLSAALGCDSTVHLTVIEVPVLADIQVSGAALDCIIESIVLDGSASIYSDLEWFDDQMVSLGTDPTLLVDQAGLYYLQASSSTDQGLCTDLDSITIIDNSILPDAPLVNVPADTVCVNTLSTYCVSNTANIDQWNWIIPTTAQLISGAGTSCIEVEWTSTDGGQICVTGENSCGEGPQTCFEIEVEQEPFLISQFEDCDLSSETFDLTLELSGADLQVVQSDIGSFLFDGNTFVAAGIEGGQTYTIVFESASCGALEVVINNDCVCENTSPVIAGGDNPFCYGSDIIFDFLGPSDDIEYQTVFVLHSDPLDVLGSILIVSDNPLFEFDNTILFPGNTYFISGVRGTPLGSGVFPFIDFADPCLELGNMLEITIGMVSEVSVSIPDICIGDPVILDATFAGVTPYELWINGFAYLFNSSGSIQLFNNPDDTYILESLVDGNGCIYTFNQAIPFEVFEPVEPELNTALVTLCNSSWENNPTSVDLNNVLVESLPGTWIDPNNTGALMNDVFNATGLSPGTYEVIFETMAVGSCPSEEVSLWIDVFTCACPSLDADSLTLCNVESDVDLSTYIPLGLEGGNWSLQIINSIGTQLPAIINDQFFFGGMDLAGSYLLIYDFTILGFVDCPVMDSLYIEVEAIEPVDLVQNSYSICADDFPLDLSVFEPSGQTGIWSTQGGDVELDGQQIMSASPGIYHLEYTAEASGVCPASSDQFELEVKALPDILAEADQLVERHCYETDVQIGSPHLCDFSNYEFLWNSITGGVISDVFACQPTVSEAGLYELIVFDSSTGCSSRDTVEVIEDLDGPVLEIEVSPISCHDFEDGLLEITEIQVQHGAYTLSLNGEELGMDAVSSLGAGSYDVVLTDEMGCSTKASFDLVNPVEMELFVLDFEQEVQIGSIVEIEVGSNYPDLEVNWYTIGGDYLDYGVVFALPVFVDQVIEIEAINNLGCVRTIETTLIAVDRYKVYVPNIFTPNGDGVNDIVTVFSGSEVAIIKDFKIFSRWGELMFEQKEFSPNDYNFGWDGYVNGQKANVGEYVWYAEVELSDGEIRMLKGDLALVQ